MKAPKLNFPITVDRFGFDYGPVRVDRIMDDPKVGVVIQLSTKREEMDIRITPGGRIKILGHDPREHST